MSRSSARIPDYERTMSTQLTRDQVGTLLAYCSEGIEDIADQAYGHPIGSVAGGFEEWLEAAVLAGHVPHVEALQLAARAHQLWTVGEAEELRRDGSLTGAVFVVEQASEAYRDLVIVLEGLIRECEGLLTDPALTIASL